jgi:hypothetical protein
MFLVSDHKEQPMNTFYEHHKGSINFAYRCFDRILLNGLIQPFQQPERVIGFFNAYRNAERVTRNCLRDIAPAVSELAKEPLRETLRTTTTSSVLACLK